MNESINESHPQSEDIANADTGTQHPLANEVKRSTYNESLNDDTS